VAEALREPYAQPASLSGQDRHIVPTSTNGKRSAHSSFEQAPTQPWGHRPGRRYPLGGSMENADGDAALHLQVLLAVETTCVPAMPAKTRSAACQGVCFGPAVTDLARLVRVLRTQGWHAISITLKATEGGFQAGHSPRPPESGAVCPRFQTNTWRWARKQTVGSCGAGLGKGLA